MVPYVKPSLPNSLDDIQSYTMTYSGNFTVCFKQSETKISALHLMTRFYYCQKTLQTQIHH